MQQSRQILTKEMFDDWLQHPVTEMLRAVVAPNLRKALHEAWEAGNLTAESVEGTAQLNARAIGEAKAWRKIEQMTYEDMEGELHGE